MTETRVGFMTTSILEEYTLEYIKAFPNDFEYLIKYQELRNYNESNRSS